MTISRRLTSAASLAAALWIPCALAADRPAAKTGDDALTCEQIYAQVDADVKRAQQERDKKAEERAKKEQGRASGAAEFHHRALSEPDVNLSAHPAPSIRLLA